MAWTSGDPGSEMETFAGERMVGIRIAGPRRRGHDINDARTSHRNQGRVIAVSQCISSRLISSRSKCGRVGGPGHMRFGNA